MLKIENKLEEDMKHGYRINIGGTTAFIQYYIPPYRLYLGQIRRLGVSLSAFASSEDIFFSIIFYSL
jgi:hypothetical protein